MRYALHRVAEKERPALEYWIDRISVQGAVTLIRRFVHNQSQMLNPIHANGLLYGLTPAERLLLAQDLESSVYSSNNITQVVD